MKAKVDTSVLHQDDFPFFLLPPVTVACPKIQKRRFNSGKNDNVIKTLSYMKGVSKRIPHTKKISFYGKWYRIYGSSCASLTVAGPYYFFGKIEEKLIVDRIKKLQTKFHCPSFISSLTANFQITKEYIVKKTKMAVTSKKKKRAKNSKKKKKKKKKKK